MSSSQPYFRDATNSPRCSYSTSQRSQTSPTQDSSPSPSSSRIGGFQGDTTVQTTMNRTNKARLTMQMMAEADKWNYHNCLAIASQIKHAGIQPDLPIYTALMNAASHVAEWQDAWAIYEDMLSLGVNPDVAVMNALMQAQRRRRSQYLWKVFDLMNERNITPNAVTFSIIVRRYLDDRNLEMALQYLYASKKYNITPDFSTTQAVIMFAAQSGHPRLAIDLISWFENQSVRRFDPATWMACLISSTEALYKDGVIQCWKAVVQDFNMNPGEGTCIAVLHTAARHGLPDLATDALRVLKLVGVSWEEHHFAALIEAFSRDNQIKEALQTLGIIRTHGINAVPETAYPLMEALKDTDALDTTWGIIDQLHKDGKEIDSTALLVMIKASVQLGDLQRAIGAYKTLSDYGISADLPMFNVLIQGCVVARHRELGNLLLEDMKAAKVKPNQDTYQNFISLCLTQDDYEDAFFYLEEMKGVGFLPELSVYEGLVEKLLTTNDSRLKIALEEIVEQGYRPSNRLQRLIRQKNEKKQKQDNGLTSQESLPLDGAAQRFIETGGLAGVAELPEGQIN